MIGASYDTVAANRAFADKYSYPYKLLCDVERSLGPAYDVDDPGDPGYPKRISFLIGPDRRILKRYDDVHTATHASDVLADLAR